MPDDMLCFTAQEPWSTVSVGKYYSPPEISLEYNVNDTWWNDYTIWTAITLTNIWDKVYIRNKSKTIDRPASQNYWYRFSMTWKIAAGWDITYITCKNWADTVWSYGFYYLFNMCTALVTAPKLPATNLWADCYFWMFYWCSNLVTIPALPATSIPYEWYRYMFYWCSSLWLSTSQTWEYKTPYRIPTSWTWSGGSYWNSYMFNGVPWWIPANPSINTTYYTSNTVV